MSTWMALGYNLMINYLVDKNIKTDEFDKFPLLLIKDIIKNVYLKNEKVKKINTQLKHFLNNNINQIKSDVSLKIKYPDKVFNINIDFNSHQTHLKQEKIKKYSSYLINHRDQLINAKKTNKGWAELADVFYEVMTKDYQHDIKTGIVKHNEKRKHRMFLSGNVDAIIAEIDLLNSSKLDKLKIKKKSPRRVTSSNTSKKKKPTPPTSPIAKRIRSKIK